MILTYWSIITTLAQSLGTFAIVTLAFGIVFYFTKIPIFLAFVFGGIALATAPAPALSIVKEFHAKGPVTETLLPMTILDDVVGIAVFFTVNSLVALLAAIVDLGAPLDYHLILGAGLYTFVYIAARTFGKYFGARAGAKFTHMPDTVQKYLGLTLLPHSGVSLVFTGIINVLCKISTA